MIIYGGKLKMETLMEMPDEPMGPHNNFFVYDPDTQLPMRLLPDENGMIFVPAGSYHLKDDVWMLIRD